MKTLMQMMKVMIINKGKARKKGGMLTLNGIPTWPMMRTWPATKAMRSRWTKNLSHPLPSIVNWNLPTTIQSKFILYISRPYPQQSNSIELLSGPPTPPPRRSTRSVTKNTSKKTVTTRGGRRATMVVIEEDDNDADEPCVTMIPCCVLPSDCVYP